MDGREWKKRRRLRARRLRESRFFRGQADSGRPFDELLDTPSQPASVGATDSFVSWATKPEGRLVMGMARLLGDWLQAKVEEMAPGCVLGGPSDLGHVAPEEFEALKARIRKSAHPEAVEPIQSQRDERQEGRSEVIREVANPKPQ